jgi:hypothetical protein
MNKKDAAAHIGIGVRTLERLIAKGEIAAFEVPGKTRSMIDLPESEVERVKNERAHPIQKARPAIAEPDATAQLARISPNTAISPASLTELGVVLRSALGASVAVPVHEKAILSISESAQFGLSRNELYEAIHTGKLKARKRRGWRIKRSDLDVFIRKL